MVRIKTVTKNYSKINTNIYYLDDDPETCAQYHFDAHVVSQIMVCTHLLSTAHRYLDGTVYIGYTAAYAKIKRWKLDDPTLENILYKVSGLDQPLSNWIFGSNRNYHWVYSLLVALCKEYSFRYNNKIHKTEESGILTALCALPSNIGNNPFSEPPMSFTENFEIIPGDTIGTYKKYYNTVRPDLLKWRDRDIPPFINIE